MTTRVVLGGSVFEASVHVQGLPSKNHDRTWVGATFAGVGDGATPLEPDWPSPVPLVEAGLASMAARVSSEPDVADLWAHAILDASGGAHVIGQPSAAMVAVRAVGADLEVSVLGDCVAIVKRRHDTGAVRLTDDTVPRRDAAADRIEHPDDRHARLVQNRLGMNRDYWIFANDVEASAHVQVFRDKAADVELVLIASDGLEPILAAEFRIMDVSTWIASEPTDVVASTLDHLRSRSRDGHVESTDDFSWVLLLGKNPPPASGPGSSR